MPAPHHSVFFTGQTPFLPPNQQHQRTEGKGKALDVNEHWKQLRTYVE